MGGVSVHNYFASSVDRQPPHSACAMGGLSVHTTFRRLLSGPSENIVFSAVSWREVVWTDNPPPTYYLVRGGPAALTEKYPKTYVL